MKQTTFLCDDHFKPHVNVTFRESLTTEEVVLEINQLRNPQIIVWYIGCYGLRKVGVEFYKNFLISPILSQNPNATFWLVDLTAWSAFKNISCSITKSHSCCNVIEKFCNRRIKCIRTSIIFKRIQEISEKKLCDYFTNALCRDFILSASRKFPDRNILIKEIFSNNGPIVDRWKNDDVSKVYSVFQYLEGCLLVEEILLQESEKTSEIQIVFALPNDELKYYKDDADSFRKDIEFFLSSRCQSLKIDVALDIRFLSFKYGSDSMQRPYNAFGETIKNSKLTHEDVTGHVDVVGQIEEIVHGGHTYANCSK